MRMIGEDIEGVTVPTVVPSGTTFYFKYTDLKSYVIFETDSGNLIRMEAKSEDGVFNQSVNGVSVYELFEALWYAA